MIVGATDQHGVTRMKDISMKTISIIAGLTLSAFASFFRKFKPSGLADILADRGAPGAKDGSHLHALNWAVVDPAASKYYGDSILDRLAPQMGQLELESEASKVRGVGEDRASVAVVLLRARP